MALARALRNPHRVQTARFEIAGPDEATLLRTRASIAEDAETALPAILAEIFDEIAGPDEVLEIARLDVDLGDLGSGALDLSALARATRRALARLPRAETDADDPPSPGAPDLSPEAAFVPLTRRRPMEQAALQALISYLTTGHLQGFDPETPLQELFAALPPAPAVAGRLIAALTAVPPAQRRAALMRLLAVAPPPVIAALLAQAPGASPTTAITSATAEQAVQAVRRAASPMQDLSGLADRMAQALWQDTAAPSEPRSDPPMDADTTRAAPQAEASLQAPNAGIVLVHPFLPQLFKLCGLHHSTGFPDDVARVTAARLIHYLATGETQGDEPMLVVPRLLCASGPDVPVLDLEPLEPAHLETADALLTSVIGHWSKLGKASPSALRETFLMRPGIVKGAPDNPRLIVEQRGVDVLLGALPWALSPVRLPWLPRPIQVDWA